MQDSWELSSWKTSSHSLRRLPGQQQQVSAGDLIVAVDSGQFSTSSAVGTLAGKALTSHDLIMQGTGASTSQAVLAVNKVSLGVCIGAGASEIAGGMQTVRLYRVALPCSQVELCAACKQPPLFAAQPLASCQWLYWRLMAAVSGGCMCGFVDWMWQLAGMRCMCIHVRVISGACRFFWPGVQGALARHGRGSQGEGSVAGIVRLCCMLLVARACSGLINPAIDLCACECCTAAADGWSVPRPCVFLDRFIWSSFLQRKAVQLRETQDG